MTTYNYLKAEGIIVPDTSTIKKGVDAEYKRIFGETLDTSPETPQGVLISAETEARKFTASAFAEVANQINPSMAGGIFLDSLCSLMGASRKGATHSILNEVEFYGVPNTMIPKGSTARVKATKELFETTSSMILDKEGKAVGSMRSVNVGPVECIAQGLDPLSATVLGWERVVNPYGANLGEYEESDIKLRERRRLTLAAQNTSQTEAIMGAILSLENVRSMSFRENWTHEPKVFDGITLKPHSIYACVEGGADEEVATTLLMRKTVGAGFNGKKKITVKDPFSFQEYDVLFDRPKEVTIYIKTTIRKNVYDYNTIIKSAILRLANGEIEGEQGFTVGSDVSPFELASAINRVEPNLFVSKLEISTDGASYTTDTLKINIDEIARVHEGLINTEVVDENTGFRFSR